MFQSQGKNENHKIRELIEDPTLVPNLPHKSAVDMFHLLIGHDSLYKHFHRIGIATSPNCLLGLEDFEMDFKHEATLQNFQDLIFKYWAVDSWTEVTSKPTRPTENVVIATKGLQDRNIHILDGTTGGIKVKQ